MAFPSRVLPGMSNKRKQIGMRDYQALNSATEAKPPAPFAMTISLFCLQSMARLQFIQVSSALRSSLLIPRILFRNFSECLSDFPWDVDAPIYKTVLLKVL